MAIKRQMCVSHPDRPAIGVCVITQQPICPECSTRYEGVNYSKDGLRILQARRATVGGHKSDTGWVILAWIFSPALLLALFGFYYSLLDGLAEFFRLGF